LDFGGSSEKGSTRKHTEKWVTSWRVLFWGNFGNSRCFTKRIYLGELELAIFEDLLVGPRKLTEEGGQLSVFLGNLIGVCVLIGVNCVGFVSILRYKKGGGFVRCGKGELFALRCARAI
jgi:hypothetical protein